MTKWSFGVLAVALVLPIVAQEGYPLKGSWIGTWAGNATHGDDVLIIMNWDGKAVSGMINPGTDNIPISTATLDPNGWKVHIEADAKDKNVKYVIDGAIKSLELPSRSIEGTWTNGKGKGKFEIKRQ
jgi:hypothetical protein